MHPYQKLGIAFTDAGPAALFARGAKIRAFHILIYEFEYRRAIEAYMGEAEGIHCILVI